jgi:hypothetical protein
MTMIPTVIGAMLTKTLVNKLIPRIGYRRILIGNTLALGAMIASFYFIDNQVPHGVLLVLADGVRRHQLLQFSAMNTLTLQDLSSEHASSGNGLLSVVMQLSMSLGWPSPPACWGSSPSARPRRVAAGWRVPPHLSVHRPDVDAGGADLRPAGAGKALSPRLRGPAGSSRRRAIGPAVRPGGRSPAGKSARGGPASR